MRLESNVSNVAISLDFCILSELAELRRESSVTIPSSLQSLPGHRRSRSGLRTTTSRLHWVSACPAVVHKEPTLNLRVTAKREAKEDAFVARGSRRISSGDCCCVSCCDFGAGSLAESCSFSHWDQLRLGLVGERHAVLSLQRDPDGEGYSVLFNPCDV
mmetsp:Transcript_59649/g.141940  ORF Transcript_59649/g.141940 Transcript_59649/m.141940 type:complete len:159 (+) Transcript_59649:89-565(+)